jgi:hypothetical protein
MAETKVWPQRRRECLDKPAVAAANPVEHRTGCCGLRLGCLPAQRLVEPATGCGSRCELRSPGNNRKLVCVASVDPPQQRVHEAFEHFVSEPGTKHLTY